VMRILDQINERLAYLGNGAEADFQWLISKLEKADRGNNESITVHLQIRMLSKQ
jgi:hypothetical protein